MSELKSGFDIQSICEVREATGLLLHSLYVGGNSLRCARINHIHITVTMPQIAYNAMYGAGDQMVINEDERKALIDTIINLINEGEYDTERADLDYGPMNYFTEEILKLVPNSHVKLYFAPREITFVVGDRSHRFRKNELFVRDTYALKHVLDTLGISHAILP